MKKAISILLLMVYLALSIGVSVSKHFCGGSLARISLFSAEKKQCACSLMKSSKESDCCEDEISVVKLATDQNLVKLNTFSFLKIMYLPTLSFFNLHLFLLKTPLFALNQEIRNQSYPPKPPLYLFFRVFRI